MLSHILKVLIACVSLSTLACSVESQVTCISNGSQCRVTDNNFLKGVTGVTSIEDCHQRCQETEKCNYLTYFGPDSFPLENYCNLFTSCESTTSCKSCVSETLGCPLPCGYKIQGPINQNNSLAVLPNVESESDCKITCASTPDCKFYTYFLKDDENYSQLCFLLNGLQEPQEPCAECRSGSALCPENQCSLTIDGDRHDHWKFEYNGGNEVDLTVNGGPECQLRVLGLAYISSETASNLLATQPIFYNF